MRAAFAIALKTMRASFRSRVVHLVLFLLFCVVVILPLTIATDGTPRGQVQVSLTYTLGLVAILLGLVTVWLGCTVITEDIEGYQIHMVTTKPVSRLVFWAGKWLGLVAMQGGLLVLAAAFILGLSYWRLHNSFTDAELATLHTEVLVGRRVYQPLPAFDFGKMVDAEYAKRIAEFPLTAGMTEPMVKDSLLRDIKSKAQELPYNSGRPWVFIGLPPGPPLPPAPKAGETPAEPPPLPSGATPLYFRYRFYVDAATNKEQRDSQGVWMVMNPATGQAMANETVHRGGVFQELYIDPRFISPKGVLQLAYVNLDPEQKSVVFQHTDGPQVMMRATSFGENYARAVLLLFIEIVFLASLACLCGALLSTPVAIFLSYSYVIVGALLVAMHPGMGDDERPASNEPFMLILFYIRVLAYHLTMSVNDLNRAALLAKGELIEWSVIGSAGLWVLVVRMGLFVVIGLWLFNRRELGLVVRK